MSTILFYAPFNQRSRDTESLMIAFHQQGHRVICLSQQEGYLINDFLNANGVEALSRVVTGKRSGWWYYLRHLLIFVGFCWKRHVDIVYSHLEPANFVAAIGQHFISGKTYICRHHIDEGRLYRFDTDLYYRITYRLARRIIVVSNLAKNYMVEQEKIPEQKITHINLAYNFDLYNDPDDSEVRAIKDQYKAELLLLSACRLTPYKRPELVIQVVKQLIDQGIDVKLVLLGKGEMHGQLQAMVSDLGLQNSVYMPGYVCNVLAFMAAADLFLHPSLLDSSCVAIKEAGLVRLPVIVCRGIGDFDDYILHETNGFFVDADKFLKQATEIIVTHFRNKDFLQTLGETLRKSVLERFSIEHVIGQYNSLNKTH